MSIQDNILLVKELTYKYARKNTSRAMLKVDLSKVSCYGDEVVHKMLIAFGFPPKFIHLMRTCVTTLPSPLP